jgi:hypothetical protein
MVVTMDMATTIHLHQALLRASTSKHTHHHHHHLCHLPLIKLELFTSNPLATWAIRL